MSYSSDLLTFELDFSIWVFFRSSCISLLVFVLILKLFSVFIEALRVSAKNISAVAGMLNCLAEYVRLVIQNDDILDCSSPACRT